MSNPLFSAAQQGGGTISNVQAVRQLMASLQGQDPNKVIPLLAQRNPQFAQFAQQCKGKTPEQVAAQYGIDLNMLKSIL